MKFRSSPWKVDEFFLPWKSTTIFEKRVGFFPDDNQPAYYKKN